MSLKTEIRWLEKSKVQNAINVVLTKQVLDGETVVATEDHACAFVVDPSEPSAVQQMRDYLTNLEDLSIGLAKLSPAQVAEIVSTHAQMWAGQQAAPVEIAVSPFEKALKLDREKK